MSESIVYNMDCMDYMRTLPDKAFDLAIVDPPYGITADKFNCASNYKGQKYKGKSTTQKIREECVKRSTLKGSGKLKDRALNRMDTSWDSEPPEDEYFTELFRVSRNQVIWGGELL